MIMEIDLVGQMLQEKGLDDSEIETWFEHHGVKGQKWGLRRNRDTGIRPAAQTLNDSKLAKLNEANVNRHNAKKAAKASRPKLSKGGKLLVGGVAVVGFAFAEKAVFKRTLNQKAGVVAGGVAAIAGGKFVANLLRGGGTKKASEIKTNP